jgi:HPt (histidine-containing phosphotransfer) domain-containing protein
MSYYYAIPLVSEDELAQVRAVLGAELARVLGYFREDGARSIIQIEEALADGNPATMVIPAHTLKGESRQFGARRLGDIAEVIERAARRCVELHSEPGEVAAEVAMLRACFVDTLAILGDVAPAAPAAPPHAAPRTATYTAGPKGFGRRGAS